MKRISIAILATALVLTSTGQVHAQQRPKAVIDALSKVCGDLWIIHDMGMGVVQKQQKVGDEEGVSKARDLMDFANKKALLYQCPGALNS